MILANVKKTVSPMPAILRQAQTGTQMNFNAFLNITLGVAVMLLATASEGIVIIPATIIKIALSIMSSGIEDGVNIDIMGSDMIIVQLFSTALPIVILMLYVHFFEKRSIRTMGFVKERSISDYLLGIAAAFAMFSGCIGICVASGAMTFDGYVLDGQYGMLAVIFAGFLIQGMSEEVVCRGFMMTSIGSKNGAFVGMLLNSLIFGVMHLGNSGVTVLSIANIVLFGVFMSIVVLKLNSIWMVCAIHSIWNFVQGNFYGVLVSGIDAGPSVLRFSGTDGMELLNGGSFGIEGGLAATIVLVVSIAVVLLIKPRENPVQNNLAA